MREFTTSDFFVLRTPLFPFEEFLNFSRELATARALANGSDLAEAIAHDRQEIRARLQEFVRRPEVQEALWIASPEFSQSLATWWNAPESAKGQKLEQSLYRYVARMTSRPTPFGLFAGCATGKIGNETRLTVGARDSYWRRSRLDMEYLCNLAEKIVADPGLRRQLLFRPNSSLYLAAGRYHHVQGYFIEEARAYRLVATDFTPYLSATLKRAAASSTPFALASALVHDDPEIALEEAEAYIGQLIESQVLVSDIVPPMTGPEPIDDMISQLAQVEAAPLVTALSAIAAGLHKLDENRLGNPPDAYQELARIVSELPASYKLEHLVQVDMMKPPGDASLDQRLIQEILRGIEVLHSMRDASQDAFRQFKQDFRERYEDQEVPLVLALDDEVGVGFERRDSPGSMAEPLLEDINFAKAEDKSEIKGTKAEFLLLRKVEELVHERKSVLELDAGLLKALKAEEPAPLPDAFSVMGIVTGNSEHTPSFYLQGVTGPSGANLLGRFCHADALLTRYVKEHLRAEEHARAGNNVVFAEIAHLPEGRIGNVIYRPILRKYEIPYLSTSRVPVDQQIPVTDLMISVPNNRIVLRSRKLGCEVLPRLTSAHGYGHGRNLKLYKFLCVLQGQGLTTGLAWNWGILDQLIFLPRVTFGRLILSLARWRLEKELTEKFAGQKGVERLRSVHEWRTNNAVPRFALLAEADNQLLIDFENALSVETFIDYAKKRPYARLLEMFPGPEGLCAHGPEGSFTHEVVIPFVRNVPVAQHENSRKAAAEKAPFVDAGSAQRSFLPGSEWLFAKIYGSPSHLDRLLVEGIKPLVENILAAHEAESWFFIRYGDPQWHLRLRFHGDPQTLSARVLPQLWQLINQQAQQGKIWQMQVDTYERELERYGGMEGIQIAERLFHFDSELALELLGSISDRLGSQTRWRLAFCSVDRLLQGLGFELNVRRDLVNNIGKSQEKNFSINQSYKKQLSEKFRKERQTLEKILSNPEEVTEFPASAHAALTRFAGQIKQVRAHLEEKQQTGRLTRSISELSGSYIHMHLNRMFRSTPNAQEMVLYDFLTRTYDSILARKGKPTVQSAIPDKHS